jgi:hypothetical protein
MDRPELRTSQRNRREKQLREGDLPVQIISCKNVARHHLRRGAQESNLPPMLSVAIAGRHQKRSAECRA